MEQKTMSHEQLEQTSKVVQGLFMYGTVIKKEECGGYQDTNDGTIHVVVHCPIDTITTDETKKLERAGFRIAQIAFMKRRTMRLDLVRFN